MTESTDMKAEKKLTSAIDEAINMSADLFLLIKDHKKAVMRKFLGIDPNIDIFDVYESGFSSSPWDSVPLREVVTSDGIVQGPNDESIYEESYSEAGYPLILPEHVKSLRFQPEGLRFIDGRTVADFHRYTARGGDIIMLRQGVDRGASALIPFTYGDSLLGSGIIRIRPYADSCDVFYMANILHFYYNTGIMRRLQEGKSGGVTVPMISELSLPLPPVEKQKQIADSMLQLSGGMVMQETYRKEVLEFRKLLGNLSTVSVHPEMTYSSES